MKYTLAISAVIFTVGFVTLPVVWGDSDFRWGELEEYEHRQNGVMPATDALYREECGSCHMAYPPGLLPEWSWRKVMGSLDDHFGDNAELDKEAMRDISRFLYANSADKSPYRRARRFGRSSSVENAPARITETLYFRHEHHEIPSRFVSGNPKVGSFSRCDACHRRAEQGYFNEHEIRIPGYGYWDD